MDTNEAKVRMSIELGNHATALHIVGDMAWGKVHAGEDADAELELAGEIVDSWRKARDDVRGTFPEGVPA